MADDEKLTSGRSTPVPSKQPGTSTLILETGDDIEYTERFAREHSVDDLLVLACGSDPAQVIERTERIDAEQKRLLTDARAAAERVGVHTAVEELSDPADLSTTGIAISSFLDDEGGTVVCFHSLTALLEAVETEQLFRFLHVLTSRVHAADAIGQFYLDPARTDDRTIYKLRSGFDTVVETDTVSRFSR
ncbi:DUF7504 family protein [Natranaeroarchaeum aerophilus]|uniref:KaiC-like domain-containing protein n=1 Tax=Natranaeroarchaeum aerophilus TaxID=2917711 RepID=A0AAE3FQR9_9EURY|nr:hypothetical protein [Natranaeroarchaeum aerophilus]MCL9813153.1 hypothetical protein [Natranaeroarchaeum aerophilus]